MFRASGFNFTIPLNNFVFILILFWITLQLLNGVTANHIITLKMANFTPENKDLYACAGLNISSIPDSEQPSGTGSAKFFNAVKFTPNANMNVVHHMLVFACDKAGHWDKVWRCGGTSEPKLVSRNPCYGSGKIIYAWARNASELTLPEGVGFQLGEEVGLNSLVLQVHFSKAKLNSGQIEIDIEISMERFNKKAGLFIMQTGGRLLPRSSDTFDAKCTLRTTGVIHPFAYRVHTHWHGRLVSGYLIRDKKWQLIGKQSPALPQAFYSIKKSGMEFQNNDILAARCYMVNTESRTVYVGSGSVNEMCNFYILYWVGANDPLLPAGCYSPGAGSQYWPDDGSIGHIPPDTTHDDLFNIL